MSLFYIMCFDKFHKLFFSTVKQGMTFGALLLVDMVIWIMGIVFTIKLIVG